MELIDQKHEHYPESFIQIAEPIKSFYFQGQPELLSHPYISVVGARSSVPWVEQWLEHELFPCLKEMGIGVVSGGARGVDQLSHTYALRAGCSSIAVLPSGLNKKYPKNIQEILGDNDKMGYLSEYEPNEEMRKHHFHKRNRLIAALSPLLLVVQAAEKSGTMITAQLAIDYGKTIGTLPSHPMDQTCSGNLKLLYEGAMLLRNQKDLEALIEQNFSSSFFARKRMKLEEGL